MSLCGFSVRFPSRLAFYAAGNHNDENGISRIYARH